MWTILPQHGQRSGGVRRRGSHPTHAARPARRRAGERTAARGRPGNSRTDCRFGPSAGSGASPHVWLAGQPALDPMAPLDDAASAIYSAFLVAEEGTASAFRAGSAGVVGEHGLPLSLDTDRGAHYIPAPAAGGEGDRSRLTQLGQGRTPVFASCPSRLIRRIRRPQARPSQAAGFARMRSEDCGTGGSSRPYRIGWSRNWRGKHRHPSGRRDKARVASTTQHGGVNLAYLLCATSRNRSE
jgi:hypothetical protein